MENIHCQKCKESMDHLVEYADGKLKVIFNCRNGYCSYGRTDEIELYESEKDELVKSFQKERDEKRGAEALGYLFGDFEKEKYKGRSHITPQELGKAEIEREIQKGIDAINRADISPKEKIYLINQINK